MKTVLTDKKEERERDAHYIVEVEVVVVGQIAPSKKQQQQLSALVC